MNGGQDLGGMMGFGPVLPEPDEPVFHADWERRVFGIVFCCDALGEWNIDSGRHAFESLNPGEYLSSSYYEIWAKGLSKLLAARGLVSPDEILAGRSLRAGGPTANPAMPGTAVPGAVSSGSPCNRPLGHPLDHPLDHRPRFKVGDPVRGRNINPAGHTRLPRYARGKRGIVKAVRGVFVFPDSNASRSDGNGLDGNGPDGNGSNGNGPNKNYLNENYRGENPQWLYSVNFTAPELWGDGADRKAAVAMDCWEPYLEPA